jgi:hypothetical protein
VSSAFSTLDHCGIIFWTRAWSHLYGLFSAIRPVAETINCLPHTFTKAFDSDSWCWERAESCRMVDCCGETPAGPWQHTTARRELCCPAVLRVRGLPQDLSQLFCVTDEHYPSWLLSIPSWKNVPLNFMISFYRPCNQRHWTLMTCGTAWLACVRYVHPCDTRTALHLSGLFTSHSFGSPARRMWRSPLA